MSPSAGRVVPQKVNFWGQGNKEKGSPRLPLGEERTNILLLACCYQEGSNPKGGHRFLSRATSLDGRRSHQWSPDALRQARVPKMKFCGRYRSFAYSALAS